MRITVTTGDVTSTETPALVVNLFAGVTEPGGATGAVDRALDGIISQLINEGEIKGKAGDIALIHTLGKIAPARVIVAGLGPADKFDAQVVRQVAADVARYLRQKGIKKAVTIAHGAGVGGLEPKASGQAIAEGSLLGLYKFGSYMSNGNQAEFEELTIVEQDSSRAREIEAGVAAGVVAAEATILARDMVNEPANMMTPTHMAEIARRVAESEGLTLNILDAPQMKEMGMGALLGVAQGSDEPPKLIVLGYHGDPGTTPATTLAWWARGSPSTPVGYR